MDNFTEHIIIQAILALLCILAIIWAFRMSEVEEIKFQQEPVVYSQKIIPSAPQTLSSLAAEEPDKTFNAWITAYNPVRSQTDSTPLITASGKMVQEGYIACPQWIPFGTNVIIEERMYECQDRMNQKHPHRFDLLFWSKSRAQNWGKRYKKIKLYYPK